MAAAARALWSHLRPGGTLAVTTFGDEMWSPMLEHFVDAVAHVRPDIEGILPWRRTEDPNVLARVLHDGSVTNVHVDQERYEIPFNPGDWRTIVMGSGLRRMAVDLGAAASEVLDTCERWAHDQQLSRVVVSANYATAVKQPVGE